MNQLLQYVISGVATGSVYSLASLGLVLTYKTSGFFNFAHGSIAAVGAMVFYEVRQQAGVPWPFAIVVTVLIVGVGGGLLLELFARSLAVAPTSIRVVSAVGLLLLLQGLVTIVVGTNGGRFDPFLPTDSVRIAGLNLGVDQIIEMLVCLAALVALVVFFRVSRLGLAMRAVVESSELLGLDGEDPVRVRRIAWIIGSTFATISGLFLATSVGLDATLFFLLVLNAFGAAAIGAFSNLTLTYVGGLVVGIGSSMSTGYLAQYASLRGLAPSLSFIVLVLVLVIFPSRLPQVVSSAVRGGRLSGGSPSPGGRSFAGLGAIAVVGALIPLFASSKILSFTTGLVTAIELLSLALLIRLSGQVSLCQVSFAAVGAGSFAQLAGEGVPWLIAVLLAGLIAVPVGALVAITAIRLSGIYLAIATFGFGILLQRLLYTSGAMFGSSGSLASPRPTIGGLDTDTGYYYVVLTFALVSALLVLLIARSRLGRMLRALGDSPTALTTAGLNVNITKVVVFCASAFLAAVSGALSGPVIGRTSSTDFFPVSSLVLVVVLLINGRGLILPSLRAALTFAIPAYISYFGRHADYLAPLFGLAAVLVCIGETRGGSTRKAEDSADPGPSRRRREGSLSGANRELVAS